MQSNSTQVLTENTSWPVEQVPPLSATTCRPMSDIMASIQQTGVPLVIPILPMYTPHILQPAICPASIPKNSNSRCTCNNSESPSYCQACCSSQTSTNTASSVQTDPVPDFPAPAMCCKAGHLPPGGLSSTTRYTGLAPGEHISLLTAQAWKQFTLEHGGSSCKPPTASGKLRAKMRSICRAAKELGKDFSTAARDGATVTAKAAGVVVGVPACAAAVAAVALPLGGVFIAGGIVYTVCAVSVRVGYKVVKGIPQLVHHIDRRLNPQFHKTVLTRQMAI